MKEVNILLLSLSHTGTSDVIPNLLGFSWFLYLVFWTVPYIVYTTDDNKMITTIVNFVLT